MSHMFYVINVETNVIMNIFDDMIEACDEALNWSNKIGGEFTVLQHQWSSEEAKEATGGEKAKAA